MDLGLQGKVAIITGGSEGIGRATAMSFGREGARLVLCARRMNELETAAREISGSTGAEVVPFRADVTEPLQIQGLVKAAIEQFGQLDILINNVGSSQMYAFNDVTDEQWQSDLEIKLFAAIRSVRAALPHLKQGGGGSIINLLNIGAKQPGPRSLPTSVTRAAGMALTKALSKDLAADNIRVNGINIGLVKSGQHERTWRGALEGSQTLDGFYTELAHRRGIPLGRVGEAEEVADLIVFLCSKQGAYITGASINVDGGLSGAV